MTRGDTRLFVAILATAFVSSVTTVTLSRLLADPACERVEQKRAEPVVVVSPPPAPPILVEPLPEPQLTCESVDEVSCVLTDYEGTCCAKYDKRTRKDGLDRAIITAGVAVVKPGIQACGQRSDAKGMVKVSVKVMPDGSVSSVMIKETPDDVLGACVAREMKRAEFARTKVGGSFSYPFRF